MVAARKTLIESPRAVLEQAGGLVGDRGREEPFVLARLQPRTFNEGDHFIEHGGIAG